MDNFSQQREITAHSFHKDNFSQQREIITLDRQGTQQQRPESPTVTAPSMQVNTKYTNSTKGTFSNKVVLEPFLTNLEKEKAYFV